MIGDLFKITFLIEVHFNPVTLKMRTTVTKSTTTKFNLSLLLWRSWKEGEREWNGCSYDVRDYVFFYDSLE